MARLRSQSQVGPSSQAGPSSSQMPVTPSTTRITPGKFASRKVDKSLAYIQGKGSNLIEDHDPKIGDLLIRATDKVAFMAYFRFMSEDTYLNIRYEFQALMENSHCKGLKGSPIHALLKYIILRYPKAFNENGKHFLDVLAKMSARKKLSTEDKDRFKQTEYWLKWLITDCSNSVHVEPDINITAADIGEPDTISDFDVCAESSSKLECGIL